MHQVTLSIVIVNYNAGVYLRRCLESLENQSYRDFEVIIIDNASRDQSIESVSDKTWVKIYCNEQNLGFAAAQNQGFRKASGAFIMPLNFDIYLQPDFLSVVILKISATAKIGTVTGKLLRMLPDGTFTNKFDNAGLLLPFRRMPVHRGLGEEDRGQYQTTDLVFGAMGAAAVYRREMLEDIAFQNQYFDESFFTWYEDIDLDWRARLRGWDCLYIPEAVAYHVGDPQKNLVSAFAARHTIRNRWSMILANECLHCALANLRWLLLEEAALLRHVLLHRLLIAYLQAAGELLWNLPYIIKKRNWIHSHALRTCLPNYPRPFQANYEGKM